MGKKADETRPASDASPGGEVIAWFNRRATPVSLPWQQNGSKLGFSVIDEPILAPVSCMEGSLALGRQSEVGRSHCSAEANTMIVDEIFADISKCRTQIKEDFGGDLHENLASHDLLFRGENFPYEKSESSMKRFLTAEDGKTMRDFYVVSPFIDFEEIYAEYHSVTHGISEEEGAGFLQHYGFPTDLFDLSPSFDTARFFAAYGRQADPIGIIGVFRRSEMENHFTITDLSKHPFALRPKNQLAFAGRPQPGIIDLKSAACDDLFESKWYRFQKSPTDFAFAAERLSIVYPTEQEIGYFFPRDLDEFANSHFTFELLSEQQRALVEAKIDSVRKQCNA
jgi:hypothetical protein